jgi:hypothetical protein
MFVNPETEARGSSQLAYELGEVAKRASRLIIPAHQFSLGNLLAHIVAYIISADQ